MFELHITCSKNIDKLKIDFSDGSSVVSETPNRDLNTGFEKFENSEPKKEVVKPIELPEITERPVKIDNILNDFEIWWSLRWMF